MVLGNKISFRFDRPAKAMLRNSNVNGFENDHVIQALAALAGVKGERGAESTCLMPIALTCSMNPSSISPSDAP